MMEWMDQMTHVVARVRVSGPVLGVLGVTEWTEVPERVAEMVNVVAGAMVQLCMAGIGLCMLVLWVRKVWLTYRGDPRGAEAVRLNEKQEEQQPELCRAVRASRRRQ